MRRSRTLLLVTPRGARALNLLSQLELPLKALFDSPTVAEMAKIIARNETKKAEQEALARMLSEVEAMSEERAQKLLNEKITQSDKPAERE